MLLGVSILILRENMSQKGSANGIKKAGNRQAGKNQRGFFPKNSATKGVVESKNSFNVIRVISKMVNYGFSLFYVGFIISVWFYPEYYSAEIIYNLTIILVFEFILVHSGVFMAVFQSKWMLAGFALFYGIFALAFNASVFGDTPIILYLYSVTVINRMVFGISSRSPQERQEAIANSVMMVLNFMFCIFAAVFLSFLVPYGGLTPAYLSSIHYFDVMTSGGEFPEKPHVAFAFGVLYFAMPIIMPLIAFIFIRKDKKLA